MTATIDLRYDPEQVARGMKRAADAMLETSRAADTLGKTAVSSARELDGVARAADASAKSVTNLKTSVGDLWRQSREDLRKLREEFQATEREAKKLSSATDYGFEGGFGMNQAQWQKAIGKRDAIAGAKGGGWWGKFSAGAAGTGAGAVGSAAYSLPGSNAVAGAATQFAETAAPQLMKALGLAIKAAPVIGWGATAIGAGKSIYGSIVNPTPEDNWSHKAADVAGMFGDKANALIKRMGGVEGNPLSDYRDYLNEAYGKSDIAYFSKMRQSNRIRPDEEADAELARLHERDRLSAAGKEQTAALKAGRASQAWDANLAATAARFNYSDQVNKALDDALKNQEKLAMEGKLDGERAIQTEKEILALKRRQGELTEKEARERKEAADWLIQRENDALGLRAKQKQVWADIRAEEKKYWDDKAAAEAKAKEDAGKAKADAIGQQADAFGPVAGDIRDLALGGVSKREFIAKRNEKIKERSDAYTQENLTEMNEWVAKQKGKLGPDSVEGYNRKAKRIEIQGRKRFEEAQRVDRKALRQDMPQIEQQAQDELAVENVKLAAKQIGLSGDTTEALSMALKKLQDLEAAVDEQQRWVDQFKDILQKGNGRARAQQ